MGRAARGRRSAATGAALCALLAGLWPGAAFAAAPDASTPIGVRSGRHPGFGRLVFDLPRGLSARWQVRDGHVVLLLDPGATLGALPTMPPNLVDVTPGTQGAEITTAPGTTVRSWNDGQRFVLDVFDRPPAGRASPAAPTPSPAALKPAHVPPASAAIAPHVADHAKFADAIPAPAMPGALTPVMATDLAPPRDAVPPSAMPAAAVMARAATADMPDIPDGALLLPASPGTGAAAFRRGTFVYVVLDERRPDAVDAVADAAALDGADPLVTELAEATVLRLTLPPPRALALTRTGRGWVATLTDAPIEAITIVPRGDVARILLPAASTGRVVPLTDAETGAVLLAGTQRAAGQATGAARTTPGFAILPTWTGVAVEPLSDSVVLRPVPAGFALEAAGLTTDLADAAPLGAAAALTRLWDLPLLKVATLQRRLAAQLAAAAAAPAQSRAEPRRALAETMLALGLGAEGQAVLALAARDDPRAADDPRLASLGAAAALLAGRPSEAAALDDPRLPPSDELRLWRALRAAGAGMPDAPAPDPAADIAATWKLAASYPPSLRARLLPTMAETMASGGQRAAAAALIAMAEANAAEAGENAAETAPLDLARAMLAEAGGDTAGALARYDALSVSSDRSLRVRAATRAIELRLASGALSPAAGADALDKLAHAWRGDAREVARTLRIAALRAAAGQWRAALSGLREAEVITPDEPSLPARRQALIAALLAAPDPADALDPLNFVALVEENAELLARADAGGALAERLADRLVALDLPARAGMVLRTLSARAADPAARASYGARLAELRLADADAAGALDALRASDAPALAPDLAERRLLLAARATARQDRSAGGLVRAAELLAGTTTPAADILRAELAEQQGDWRDAAARLGVIAGDLLRTGTTVRAPFDPEQKRMLLRWATDAARADDPALLTPLRAIDPARLGDGADAALFRVLVWPPVRGVADLPRARAEATTAAAITSNTSASAASASASPRVADARSTSSP